MLMYGLYTENLARTGMVGRSSSFNISYSSLLIIHSPHINRKICPHLVPMKMCIKYASYFYKKKCKFGVEYGPFVLMIFLTKLIINSTMRRCSKNFYN